MSNIDKEWLKQKISDMEAARDEIPFCLDEDDSNTLAALRIALASRELERGMIRRFDLDMSDCDSCGQDCGADMVEDLDGEYVLWDEVLPHLYRYDEYTAHPAPVSVPDDVMSALQKVARIRLDLNDFDGDRRGIAECLGEAEEALIEVVNRRAAMLQGADGNSPVIPDGWIPVSERMPGSQEWVIVFAKWGNQQVLCWDDVANRWTDFEDQSYYADMFTHWMPLPAAPQQEVK